MLGSLRDVQWKPCILVEEVVELEACHINACQNAGIGDQQTFLSRNCKYQNLYNLHISHLETVVLLALWILVRASKEAL